MGRAKGVVDVDLSQGGQFAAEIRVVLGLAGMEAQVFKQQDIAGLESLGHGLDLGTDTVRGELDLASQEFGQAFGHGLQGKFGSRSALGTAQMGTDHQGCAPVQGHLQGREALPDAVVVGDDPVFQGHVVVDTHENALAADVQFVQKSHMGCLRGLEDW